MGQPRDLFVYYRSFQKFYILRKLLASLGFKLGSSELRASTLTNRLPPRPKQKPF